MRRFEFITAALCSLVVACGSPCRTACDRIARCVDDPSINVGTCSVMCREVHDQLQGRPKGPERFRSFIACAEALPYTHPQCSSAFVQCAAMIPQAVMSNAIRNATRH
jgi:hypothetical protein